MVVDRRAYFESRIIILCMIRGGTIARSNGQRARRGSARPGLRTLWRRPSWVRIPPPAPKEFDDETMMQSARSATLSRRTAPSRRHFRRVLLDGRIIWLHLSRPEWQAQ